MYRNVFQACVLLSILLLAGCGAPVASRTRSSAPLSVYIGSTDGTVSALRPGNGTVRWRYHVTCACPADVQALANGMVYVSATLNPGRPSASTVLYALNAADGSVRWQMATPGTGTFSAVIKNVAYITLAAANDEYNEMQARNASDGALLWHTRVAGTGDLAATVADETVYLASFDSQRYYYNEHRWTAFYALNLADGTIRWHRTLSLGDAILAAANGQLYAQEGLTDVVCSSNAAALNASDGTERWVFPKDARDWRDCTSLIGAEHNLVYGITTHENPPSVQSSIYALNADGGSRSWQVDLPFDIHGALLANGTIYLPSNDALVAYSARDGSLRWHVQGGSNQIFSFDGVLYRSIWGQSLDALNPATGTLRWRYQTDETVSLSAVASGTLYGISSTPATGSAQQHDIVALNAGDGKLLWRFQIGASEDAPLVG